MSTVINQASSQSIAESVRPGVLGRIKPKYLWLVAHLYASFLLVQLYAGFSGFYSWPAASLDLMVSGKASRPYVTRALVPILINLIDSVTPAKVKDIAYHIGTSPAIHPEFNLRGYTFNKAVFLLLAFLMFLATGYIFKALSAHYFHYPEAQAHAAGIIGLMLIPSMYRYVNHIYDPPTVLLSAGMLLALARRKMRHFIYIFLLACINKETAILAVLVLAAFYWRDGRKWTTITAWCGALGVAWFYIRHRIEAIFAGNPGTQIERHFWNHQMVILRDLPLTLFYAVLVMGTLLMLAFYRWQQKPWELRAGLLLTFVPIFVLSIFFGFLDEIRIFYDASPYLFLLAIPSLMELLGPAPQLVTRDSACPERSATESNG